MRRCLQGSCGRLRPSRAPDPRRHPRTALARDAGVPDRPVSVRADPGESSTWPEIGPDPSVDQLTRVSDRPRAQPIGVRLGYNKCVVVQYGHPVGEPQVVGDLTADPVGQHDGDDPRLGIFPWHRPRHVDPCPSGAVDHDLVKWLTSSALLPERLP